MIVEPEAVILVTGATGFIGLRVVERLAELGFRNVRCLARQSNGSEKLKNLVLRYKHTTNIEMLQGDLLSKEDCLTAARNVALIYHLAAGRGIKSFPDAFLNSVVTTRNLMEAAAKQGCLRRFVNVSSLSVYSNCRNGDGKQLDESCPVEPHPERRDAYSFAKIKQDQIVTEYGAKLRIPYVIIRPGVVYGPGNEAIHGRVGIGTFGLFLHLGGSNPIPFTYVENCAEAIVLAGLKENIEREVFNVVDDHPPSSRRFLRLYKKNVKAFRSLYVPHWLSYLLCAGWEKYSQWSEGQLPPVFTRAVWASYWKPARYPNAKIKSRLGWKAKVSSAEAFGRYFDSCKRKAAHA